MELLIFIGLSLGLFTLPLIMFRLGREWLIALLPILLITGNVFAQAFTTVLGQLTSYAIPVYATTFLITDLLSEHYGPREALRAVWIGFLGQAIFLAVMLVILFSPVISPYAEAYDAALAAVPRLVLGSFTAYVISQNFDVRFYHFIKKLTGGRWLALRNNLSTAVSQGIDTVIFLGIAFWGVAPLEEPTAFWNFVLFTWVFKILTAAVDTPFLYASRALVKRGEV